MDVTVAIVELQCAEVMMVVWSLVGRLASVIVRGVGGGDGYELRCC